MLRRFAVAVFGVALAFSMSTPAFASYPGKNGLIAFDRASQIYTISPSGTGLKKLTSTGKNYDPVWNPAGTEIAYEHVLSPSGAHDIWVMNANGSNKRQWTATAVTVGAPAWSPSGKTLVFGNTEAWYDPDCCDLTSPMLVTTSATVPLRPLRLLYGNNQDNFGEHTRLVGFNPSWTEGRIAFHSDPVEHGVNGDTCDGAPTGSSDMGANCVEVYFTATGNFSMPPGPGEATQCGSAGGGSNYAYVTWPRWAPDGSDLLYSYQMWPPNGNCSALPWQVARAYGGALPSQPGDQQADFSPNGSFIVLVNVLPGQTAGKIIIESNIGTNRRTLTQGYQPNWQPVP